MPGGRAMDSESQGQASAAALLNDPPLAPSGRRLIRTPWGGPGTPGGSPAALVRAGALWPGLLSAPRGRFLLLFPNRCIIPVTWLFFILGFVAYCGALAIRHAWFQTSAWDLAIFDQAVFLIGQGLPAQSSFLGYHILGDHGALVLYPLGWMSRLIPSPALLFVVQSAALASSVFPLAELARLRGLSRRAIAASLAAILLYPVVFNSAIFDFHPETLAFPLVVQILWFLERSKPRDGWRVFGLLVLALTCKLGLSLLVLGLGFWVFVQGRRVFGGAIAALGIVWFFVISSWLIPHFGGDEAQLLRHGSKFGVNALAASASEMAWIVVVRQLLTQIFSLSSVEYLVLLMLPVLYVLLHRQVRRLFSGLIPFVPLLLLNLAASRPSLKDLVNHYSLFLVPF